MIGLNFTKSNYISYLQAALLSLGDELWCDKNCDIMAKMVNFDFSLSGFWTGFKNSLMNIIKS
jgi:hypothetical protein